MEQLIENNWLSLLSIGIGILVACLFHHQQRKDSTLAVHQRKKHATDELLDVIESHIINKQPLSQYVIENLVLASERDHAVSLRATCHPTALLQDVALRFQRSRHLDIPQKTEYYLKIEELIRKLKENREPSLHDQMSAEVGQELAQFETLVPEDKREEVRKRLARLISVADGQRALSSRKEQGNPVFFGTGAALAGVIAALATGLIGSGLYDVVVSSAFNRLSSPTLNNLSQALPIIGAVVLIPVLYLATTTVLRIRRRSPGIFRG
jgi:hypothetical protein